MTKQNYPPIAYIAAAIGYRVWVEWQHPDAEFLPIPNSDTELQKWFQGRFSSPISKEQASAAIAYLSSVGLVTFDEDEYAGRFLQSDEAVFDSKWREVASTDSSSPFAKAHQFGDDWVRAFLANAHFWDRLSGSDLLTDVNEAPKISSKPADRIIVILPDSDDGKELENGLVAIEDELRTNNAIAQHLGDDRDRIFGEIRASIELLKGKFVRVSALKEILIKVLKEVMVKLKEKAVDLGVEKLLQIAIGLIS